MIRNEIAPSILSADFARLGEEVQLVAPYSGRIHIDVMDGHFVPNLSMGPALVASLRKITQLPLEVHLMVEDPGSFIEAFFKAGADRIIFHVEVAADPVELAERIQAYGIKAGIALNPTTAWEIVSITKVPVDLVTLMTVNPGFGGQRFLREVLPKVSKARSEITEGKLSVDIEVDGGIDTGSITRAKDAGANVFVAGNAIFGSSDAKAAAERLAELVGASHADNLEEGS